MLKVSFNCGRKNGFQRELIIVQIDANNRAFVYDAIAMDCRYSICNIRILQKPVSTSCHLSFHHSLIPH